MQERDLLEKYTSQNKIYNIFEEHREGKFIFYAEGPDGNKIGETEADAKTVTDPSKNAAKDIINKIKGQIDGI